VDFDLDGDLDLLVSNGDTLDDDVLKPYHGVSWLENLGDLRFEVHVIGHLYGCESACSGDVDGALSSTEATPKQPVSSTTP
jgi:hypothetical protein